jgi:hypothetical protein
VANAFVTLNTGTGGANAQTFRNTISATSVDANAVSLVDQFGIPIGSAGTTGTITATDAVVAAPANDGLARTGASTAGSLVALQVPGADAICNCQITGLTSGTLWFEWSTDSTTGTDGNWYVLNVLRDAVLGSIIQQSATANGMYSGNCSGAAWIRVRSVGTLTGTPAIRWRLSPGTSEVFLASSIPPGTNAIGKVETESAKATYGVSGLLNTPAATTTDFLTITGSATKTVRIKRIALSGAATTAGSLLISLVRRSTANSGGTSTAPTRVQHDTADAAPTATVALYSANPTAVGTAVGNIHGGRLFLNVATTATPDRLVFEFSTRNDEAIVLRGTGQILAVNFNAFAVPAGGAVDFDIEWTEE